MIIVKGIGLGIGLAILYIGCSYDSSICLRSALTPIMPTETQHRIPDFCTPGRWKMDHHLTPSHGATGRTGSKIDIFGHLAFGIYNRYHLNAQGCY